RNIAAKRVTPKKHEIRVQLRGNVQHRGSTELCRRRQTVPLELRRAGFVSKHLPARSRQPLDGQLLQSFAEPLRTRPPACILERKYEKATVRWTGGRRTCGSGLPRSVPRQKTDPRNRAQPAP